MIYINIRDDSGYNIYRSTPPVEDALLYIPYRRYEYYDSELNTYTKIPESLAIWIIERIK